MASSEPAGDGYVWRAEYQCRQCGIILISRGQFDEIKYIEFFTNMDQGKPMGWFNPWEIHSCDDNRRGHADFIGVTRRLKPKGDDNE